MHNQASLFAMSIILVQTLITNKHIQVNIYDAFVNLKAVLVAMYVKDVN